MMLELHKRTQEQSKNNSTRQFVIITIVGLQCLRGGVPIDQRLRPLAVLPKTQVAFPLTTAWNSSSRETDALFWSPQKLHRIKAKTPITVKINFDKNESVCVCTKTQAPPWNSRG